MFLKMLTKRDKRLASALRKDLRFPETISDEEILIEVSGSLTSARIALGLAISDFKEALIEALKEQFKWLKL